jgi:ribosomal protein S27AE
MTEFYVHPQMGDGRLNKCKACTRHDVSANYRANIDHYIGYERARSQQPERRTAMRDYRGRRPSLKRSATTATSNAIRDGRLVPQPCEKCGSENVEAHHDDYSKPLDVRWLCRKHHLEHHGKVSRVA